MPIFPLQPLAEWDVGLVDLQYAALDVGFDGGGKGVAHLGQDHPAVFRRAVTAG